MSVSAGAAGRAPQELRRQAARMMRTAEPLESGDGSWPPDPPAWSGDEAGTVASACCLQCHRQIATSELEITLTSLPDGFCPWCARPSVGGARVIGGPAARAVEGSVVEIRASIAMATRKIIRATSATTPLYAELIRAVIAADQAGVSRAVIAKMIRDEHESERRRRLVKHTDGKVEQVVKHCKGSAARYVMLARWEQEKWLKGEQRVQAVEIEGHEYRSLLKALDAGQFSFRKVFLAWRDAVRPTVTDLNDCPRSVPQAAERVVARLTLPVLVTEDGREIVRRVKVMQSAEALAALLRLLHASPLAKEAERLRMRETRARPHAELSARAGVG